MKELENKKEYEMSYLLSPEISEEKLDSEIAEVKKIIVENGGDEIQANLPIKRRLAYPVKKQNQAYFGVVYFNTDGEGLEKMKKVLALNKKILRLLILNKVIKQKPIPTIISEQPAETSEKASVPTQSFDQKLEDILKGQQ